MKRGFYLLGLLGVLCMGVTSPVHARKSGGSGGSHSVDPANTQVVKLSNFNRTYNGKSAKGQVTLGYAADGTAQSMDYNLSQINVPDGTVLPVSVIMGRYELIVSYYTYYGLAYTTVQGTVTVKNGSVLLSLNKLNGDVIPDFPPSGVGTTEIQIFSADGATLILDGSAGTLRP